MTIIIQAVEAGGRPVGRNFPAIEFAGKKSPDLAFSNVDRYANQHSAYLCIAMVTSCFLILLNVKVNLHSIRFSYVFVRFFTFLLLEKVCAFSSAFL